MRAGAFTTLSVFIMLFGIILFAGCKNTVPDTAYVVKDVIITPPPPENASNATENIIENQTIHAILPEPVTFTVFSGEQIPISGKMVRILASGNGALFQTVNTSLTLQVGNKGELEGIPITLIAVNTTRKESYGLVKFFFQFGKEQKEYSFVEQEEKAFQEAKYTLTLLFVGKRNGRDVAIFAMNGEQTKPLFEADSYYFKDGSALYIENIMRSKSPRIVETANVTFEATP